jgi:hypothetical protein
MPKRPAPPTTLAELLEALAAVEHALPASDGVHWFARLYREATHDVAAALAGGGFEDPRSLEGLGVVCGATFLGALEAAGDGRHVPRAWAPLIAARHDRRVAPLQFAIAGLNAHMNCDLAHGLAAGWRAAGVDPGHAAAQHRDFDRLDGLIAATERRVKPWLLTGAVKEVDRRFEGVDDVVAGFVVGRAHDAAWTAGEVLWHLRGAPPLAAAYGVALERGAGMASRLLLVPTAVA